jgi:CrcB protein
MSRYLLVLVGAAAGGVARYIVWAAITQRFSGRFPLGTLVVNLTGCFAIGILMTLLTERWVANPQWRLLLVTGVLGGYTTYSSFAWETYQSVREGSPWMGLIYVMTSVMLGYLAVWSGALLARR